MRSFFVSALIGATAVNAISAENMAQMEAKPVRLANSVNEIKTGDVLYARCPYTQNYKSRTHWRANADTDLYQVATADAKTDDDVEAFFSFENMGLNSDNVVQATLHKVSTTSRRDWIKARRYCEFEDATAVQSNAAPVRVTSSPSVKHDVAMQIVVPGGDFSMWDNKDVLDGVASY